MSGPWCSSCGREARPNGPSLDPDHPLVWCAWVNADGEPRGHGLVPGIEDRAELAEIMAIHRVNRQAKAHARHMLHKLVPSCPLCQAARVPSV